jgi:acetyl esterase/lipase
VEDAKSAVRWIRAHAGELGVDPRRIAAAGGSAGGHIAAATATVPGQDAAGEDTAISSAPNALVLFNPVVMVTSVEGVWEMPANLRERFGPGQLSDLSPFDHVRRDHPPTLIQHGVADALVPLATVRAYCDRVVERGSRCDVAEYEGGAHGFFNNDPFYEPTVERMIQFLQSIGWIER